MKKEKKVWAIILIALGGLAPQQIYGQQDSTSYGRLDAVVVTATKFSKAQSETGKVLTVITEEQLQRSAGKDLSQLLNEQVGIVINGSGSNPGKDKSVYLRGAKTDYTVILIDGIPLNDPSGFGGAFDLRLIPVDQIERIEILKGSQSTLYGSDAIAGVINLITKKKGEKPFGAFGSIGYGSYNTLRGTVGARGSADFIDYNISYTRHKSDGVSEAKDKEGGQNFDKDSYDQQGVQANFALRTAEKITVNPFVRFNKFDGDFDGGSFTDSKAFSETQVFNTGLLGKFDFARGSVNLQYSYDKSTRKYDYDGFESKFDGRFNHAEAFVNYSFSDFVQLLGGVNAQHLRMVGTNTDKSVLLTSSYAALYFKNQKGLNLEVGGRYVNHEEFGNTFTYSINPSLMVMQNFKVFADFSTAFKAPTLSQLYGAFGANPELDPELGRHLEAGIQYLSASGKVDVRVTAFKRRIEDAIAYTTGYINLDEQNDHGLEVEPTWQPNEKLRMGLFYAYVTGEITTKAGGDGVDTTYNNLLRRPKHSFGLHVGYQFTPRFYMSLNAKTFGKRQDRYFDNSTFTTKATTLDAYALVDVYAEYFLLPVKQLKLFVDVRNILDSDYTEVAGYNTMGVNLMAGVSVAF